MLLNGRTGREEKSPIQVADVVRMRELSIRLGKSRSTAAVDSGGDRAVERKASSSLGASSGVDTRFAEYKRAEFDLRDLREHSHQGMQKRGMTAVSPIMAKERRYTSETAVTCPGMHLRCGMIAAYPVEL